MKTMIAQILQFTPRWVFGMLAGLVIAGLMQARTRRVPIAVALGIPVAMLGVSLSGVVQSLGASWPALAGWLCGVGASSALVLGAMRPGTATWDPASRRLIIAGSWVPLLVFLGIFVVRFAMGVAQGMGLGVIRSVSAQAAAALMLGALSGFFVARGLHFWRVQASHRAA